MSMASAEGAVGRELGYGWATMPARAAPACDFLAIGHITTDRLADSQMVGGAAYYASRTAVGFGLAAGAWTSFGADFPHAEELAGLSLFVEPAAHTSCFENHYEPAGRRQVLRSRAADLGDPPTPLAQVPVLYLCPVIGELDLDRLVCPSSSLIGVGAQGWLRQAGSDGLVQPRRWRPTASQLSEARLVVLSDEDVGTDAELVPLLAAQVPLCAFTHGAAGSELFVAGTRHLIPAFPTTQIGPTGAGDVFGASMLIALSWGYEPLHAAYFASCAAAISVQAQGGRALDRLPETFALLGEYGRIHGVSVPQR